MNQKQKSKVTAAGATIRDEFTVLSPGHIGAVITHLEMHALPRLSPDPADTPYELRHVPEPDLDWYRSLYRTVGENWLWFSRLTLDDTALAKLIHDPAILVHALHHNGREAGMLELDARRFPDVEISFLGVVEDLIGKGAGRCLLNRALEISWARSPRRVTVHACTLDHPRAVGC
jgi:GNAT superfamily N-acetyltransferase